VNALWLLDLEEFNEWMNEEDYLVDDEEVCVTCYFTESSAYRARCMSVGGFMN